MVLAKNAFTSNVQTPNVPAPKIKIPSSKTQTNDFEVGSVLSKGQPPLVRTVTLTKAHLDQRKVNSTFYSTEKLTKKYVFGVRPSHWIYLERIPTHCHLPTPGRYTLPLITYSLVSHTPIHITSMPLHGKPQTADQEVTVHNPKRNKNAPRGHMGCRPQHYVPTDMAPGSRFNALSPVISPAHFPTNMLEYVLNWN
ncbi:hypothetical protein J6590_081600 [Homalodisca vitripennis]|nr:hypothetical protein J6590_081600 [Homalodisca vitripennis]